mgnify:CR=1 FL=1
MAGRAAIMLALGIPVAAGLLYLVLGSAPLAYPLANALALLIAVPIAAFAPLRLAVPPAPGRRWPLAVPAG